MTALTRLLGALSICSLGIAASFAVMPSDTPRAHIELCREVDYELNEAVRSGLLTQEEALAISQRCYQRP